MNQGDEADELTPIDRPLMRSDLNEIRVIVWSISARQLTQQRNQWASTLICVFCTLVCIGCAVAGIK
jgi:hypothetical protein